VLIATLKIGVITNSDVDMVLRPKICLLGAILHSDVDLLSWLWTKRSTFSNTIQRLWQIVSQAAKLTERVPSLMLKQFAFLIFVLIQKMVSRAPLVILFTEFMELQHILQFLPVDCLSRLMKYLEIINQNRKDNIMKD